MNGSSGSSSSGGGESGGPGGGGEPEASGDDCCVAEFPQYMKINATFFCCLILVIGVFGNLLVPLVIWKNKDMRNSTNLFLVNLSVADLLVLLVCMPTVIVEMHTAQPESWVLGQGMCKAVPFLEMTMAHGSVLTILAISFERYYAICKPLTASYKLTQVRALVMIALLWVGAGAATGPVLAIAEYTWREYLDETLVPVCVTELRTLWRKVYFVAIIGLLFFLPLMVLVIIYAVITRHLMVTPCIMGTRLDTTNMRARKQVVMMLVAVVVFFFICLLPYRLFTIWIIVSAEEDIEAIGMETYYNLLLFCRIMLYINSAINPILYNVMSSKFREAFMRVLGCQRGEKRKKLDRQTTFNTTYTSLSSSIKVRGTAETVVTTTTTSTTTCTSCTACTAGGASNGHFVPQNSSQDSAV